jgi:CMP-N,N'-diacetyllegionaminic acid synthase
MFSGKNILGVIPARGGSKGVPRKNLREVGGKPLIAWTIENSKKAKYIDRIILSSEDSEIISVAKQWECDVPFVRPEELALDDTPGIDPVLHAINLLAEEYDYVVLLQPTSPLRTADDMDRCIELCFSRNAPACVSVTEMEKSPYWMYTVDTEGHLHNLLKINKIFQRRQDMPKVFALNGAVYVAEIRWLIKTRTFVTDQTVAYAMPRERSLDIDTEMDLRFCDVIMQESQR